MKCIVDDVILLTVAWNIILIEEDMMFIFILFVAWIKTLILTFNNKQFLGQGLNADGTRTFVYYQIIFSFWYVLLNCKYSNQNSVTICSVPVAWKKDLKNTKNR